MTKLPILSCSNCGICCHLQRVPPFMDTELSALPPALAAEVEAEAEIGEADGGPCVWLNGAKQCSHYEHRPEVCRQFELGAEDCLEMRARHGL